MKLNSLECAKEVIPNVLHATLENNLDWNGPRWAGMGWKVLERIELDARAMLAYLFKAFQPSAEVAHPRHILFAFSKHFVGTTSATPHVW